MEHFKRRLAISVGSLAAFIVWTAAVRCVDVQAIGPLDSQVGFARLNRFFHRLTGVHFTLYEITDWLSLIPAAVCMGFGMLGLCQWIRRRSPLNVDRSLLVLGVCYAVVMAVYLLFEIRIVNRRPVLIDGVLEASYPSSTTMLVLCVMSTAMMQLSSRIRSQKLRKITLSLMTAFTAFMVMARLLSGVHWLTDIIGGTPISAALVMMYAAFGA